MELRPNRGCDVTAEPLSEKDHWDSTWTNISLPRSIDLANPIFAEYHTLFGRIFRSLQVCENEAITLLEVGCAATAWLPYFNKYHGFSVYGIDYSPGGVELARRNLAMLGVPGHIILADITRNEAIFDRQFDVIVSFGLVEHFNSPDVIIAKMTAYLKRGGLVITGIPNLRGIFGLALKTFRKDLYAIHNPLDLRALQSFHEKAGLQPYEIPGYIGGIDLSMLAATTMPKALPRVIRAGISTLTHYTNPVLRRILRLLSTTAVRRFAAPDILLIYRK